MLNLRENEYGRGVRQVVLFALDSRGKWLAGML